MAEATDRFRSALSLLVSRDLLEPNPNAVPPLLVPAGEPDFTSTFSRDQRLTADVFWGASEIWESLERLDDIEIYLSRTPYTGLGVPKSRHLAYHIGNYLHETYILRERATAFADKLLKKYRKDPPPVPSAVKSAKAALQAALEDTVAARGVHVHSQRFKEPNLHRLFGMELALEESEQPKIRDFAKRRAAQIYRREAARWRSRIKHENQQAHAAINVFFATLYPVVFDPDGEIRRPQNWLSSRGHG